jgi:hypothetical protein
MGDLPLSVCLSLSFCLPNSRPHFWLSSSNNVQYCQVQIGANDYKAFLVILISSIQIVLAVETDGQYLNEYSPFTRKHRTRLLSSFSCLLACLLACLLFVPYTALHSSSLRLHQTCDSTRTRTRTALPHGPKKEQEQEK